MMLDEGSGMGVRSGLGSGLGSGMILGESGTDSTSLDPETEEGLCTESKSGLLTADNMIPVTSKRTSLFVFR